MLTFRLAKPARAGFVVLFHTVSTKAGYRNTVLKRPPLAQVCSLAFAARRTCVNIPRHKHPTAQASAACLAPAIRDRISGKLLLLYSVRLITAARASMQHSLCGVAYLRGYSNPQAPAACLRQRKERLIFREFAS